MFGVYVQSAEVSHIVDFYYILYCVVVIFISIYVSATMPADRLFFFFLLFVVSRKSSIHFFFLLAERLFDCSTVRLQPHIKKINVSLAFNI